MSNRNVDARGARRSAVRRSLAGLVFVAAWLVGCAQSPEAVARSEARWVEIAKSDVAKVASGWSTPVRIEGLSTPGWEDGAFLSADGKTLYFIYTDLDVFAFPTLRRAGPNRDPEGICFLGCGSFPRADLFYSTRQGNGWSEPKIHPLTIETPIGGFILANKNRGYFMYTEEDSWGHDIGFADRKGGEWGKPQRIKNVSSEDTDRDPWIGPDEQELWFTSDRKAAMGGENIFISKRQGKGWGPPVMAPAPLNSEQNEMQPFLHGGYVYFASTRGGSLAIYRSKRNGDRFAEPELVVESQHGVGEPTLSANGKILSFVQVFRDGSSSTIDLMEIRRR